LFKPVFLSKPIAWYPHVQVDYAFESVILRFDGVMAEKLFQLKNSNKCEVK
jgi:hypothetical protein